MPNTTNIAELSAITRQNILDAIESDQVKEIPTGEHYSMVYQGRRFDHKQLLALAYTFATTQRADIEKWQEFSHTPFIEVLTEHGFRVVKSSGRLGDIGLPSMVYEVKSPDAVQANYQKLFSTDRTRFYWNNDKFKKLKNGDVVFVVNARAREVHYCLVETLTITTSYDSVRDITTFNHAGEQYEVAGQWAEFVCLRVRDSQIVGNSWKWKTLGSGENTYISGPEINVSSAANNIERVNQLIEAFGADTEAELQLRVCYQALKTANDSQPQVEEETEPAIWYVMQGATFTEDIGKKYLFAPLRNKRGSELVHWSAMKDIKAGDVIVQHASGVVALSKALSAYSVTENPDASDDWWSGQGFKVPIQAICEFDPVISVEKIRSLKTKLDTALSEKRGPYNSNGQGNQGYLFEFTWEALAILLSETNVTLPREISRWLPELPPNEDVDQEINEPNSALPVKESLHQPSEWLPKVQRYMQAKGFYYSLADVTNFYLSIRTKPLVLLAGISGTGKTQIVRQFAKAIGYGGDRHCVLIPVRPDWADNSDLIGYKNVQGKFEQQKLLKVLQDALAHPDEPFFVILDEMNLARVEHYFSDFLSIMETRERDTNGIIKTSPVVSDTTVNRGVPVAIPQNVIIVGTVNMDETTHPFSRKVLDRANAIEMNEISLPWRDAADTAEPTVSGVYSDSFVTPYLNSIDLSIEQKDYLNGVIELLMALNHILEPAGLHFGYRVRDEIAFYLCQHSELKLSDEIMSPDQALDYQLMQKVLPRIQGSALSVLQAILMMIKELSGAKITKDMELLEVEQAVGSIDAELKYPKSVKKLLFMLRRFNNDGFTSFWL